MSKFVHLIHYPIDNYCAPMYVSPVSKSAKASATDSNITQTEEV